MNRVPAPRAGAALVAFVAVLLASVAVARAQTSTTRPSTTTIPPDCCVSISASPTTDLTDGSVVTVHLDAWVAGRHKPTTLQLCTAALCATSGPHPDADAFFTATPPTPDGPWDIPFRIAHGTFRTADGRTFPCGPGAPCILRVDAGFHFGAFTIRRDFPLTYAGDPVVTTTTMPAHPWCELGRHLPPWLWRILARLLDLPC